MKFFLARFAFIIATVAVVGWLCWTIGFKFLQTHTPFKDEIIILTSTVIDDNKGIFIIAHVGSQVPKPSLHTLSGKTIVTLPEAYGEYELGAVLPLLDLEGKTTAYKQAVFSRILTVPVSSFLAVQEPVTVAADFSQLCRVLQRTAFEKLRRFELPWQEVALLPLLKNQQVETLSTSLEEMQAQLQTAMIRSVSRSELACTLAIVNTTEESGLARQLATVLEQGGVRVVRITDTSQLQEHSKLLMDTNRTECAWIVPLVRSWFFTDIAVEQDSEAEQIYRAWGVVFIGSDAH
ncbi:MAG: LytR C-terminal domain-containing protein [Candidatus Pacebacteria bacterium]|nr:LytR C-terminal domain-containing protein [Candidatus Paceibacterota bacterium]